MKAALFTLLCLAVLMPGFSSAQGEQNVWAFGYNAGLDFNSGSPVAFETDMHTNEGCASVCDQDGNLLMYTNGQDVWNRDHDIMPNGNFLVSYEVNSATQSTVIVPMPGNSNKYYVFSLEEIYYPGRLSYSVVDMTLDGGLGDVVAGEKGILLATGFDEKMTAVKGECNSVWVVVHSKTANEYKAFKVDETGVSTTPVVSPISTGFYENAYMVGVIKFSPNGKKMAAAVVLGPMYGIHCLELYDFDAATGVISNTVGLLKDEWPFYMSYMSHGVCFSPDNTKLYVTSEMNPNILQYDVTLTDPDDILASGVDVNTSGAGIYGDMKIGPDGKIYVIGIMENSVSTIDYPNLAGTACSFSHASVPLSGETIGFLGLPNSVPLPYFESTAKDTFTCAPLVLSGREAADGFLWSTGDTTRTITTVGTGIYWVKSSGCENAIDTFHVYADTLNPPLISMDDMILCPEIDSFTIIPSVENAINPTYQWTPETGILSLPDQKNIVVRPGTTGSYILTVTNNQGPCRSAATDTIRIEYYPVQAIALTAEELTACYGEQVDIDIETQGMFEYHWGPEEWIVSVQGHSATVIAGPSLYYGVTARDGNNCIVKDSVAIETKHCCTLLLPNAFSPNGDGNNDIFKPELEAAQRINEFSVFNRLGQRLFISYNSGEGWDGTFNGVPVDLGVYFYYFKYTCSDGNNYIIKGDVSLLR